MSNETAWHSRSGGRVGAIASARKIRKEAILPAYRPVFPANSAKRDFQAQCRPHGPDSRVRLFRRRARRFDLSARGRCRSQSVPRAPSPASQIFRRSGRTRGRRGESPTYFGPTAGERTTRAFLKSRRSARFVPSSSRRPDSRAEDPRAFPLRQPFLQTKSSRKDRPRSHLEHLLQTSGGSR